MTEDELSEDEVLNLLAEPSRSTTTRTRGKSGDEERTLKHWFDRPHTKKPCEVPKHHKESRSVTKGLTTMIDGVAVCRVCYLDGKDRDDGESV